MGVLGNLGLGQRQNRREGPGGVSVQCLVQTMVCLPTGFPSSSEKESVVDLGFLLLRLGFIIFFFEVDTCLCLFYLLKFVAKHFVC